jgi:predicted Zn-dependent protease
LNFRIEWFRIRQKEPVIVGVLFLLAIVAFGAVTALTKSYTTRQRHVTWDLYTRAGSALKSGNMPEAIRAFRAALDLAPDNSLYQLGLAKALMAGGRNAEALTYLEILWDKQPENGEVNLELARNYAAGGDTEQAIRHYQNAIYSVWRTDPDINRRTVRFELIHYLIAHGAKTQANAELVALAGNLPEDTTLRTQVAALFFDTKDYTRALSQYERVLRIDAQNKDALAGAGQAAFQLGQFATAQKFLSEAVRQDSNDSESAEDLKISALVHAVDPFDRRISEAERRARVIDAFHVASKRLQACASSSDQRDRFQDLMQRQVAMQARVSSLSQKPEFSTSVMDLVFEIEEFTQGICGTPVDKDLALSLLSKHWENAEQ